MPNSVIAAVAQSHMSTSTSLSYFPFVHPVLLGDFFGVGLEVCRLVLLVHFAHFMVVLMGSPFSITDRAPTMFPPLLFKAQRVIFNFWRLLSLIGCCFSPIGLVMNIRFRVVGQEREEVGIFMIFLSHVLPAGQHLSIPGPRSSIRYILDILMTAIFLQSRFPWP